MKKKHSDLGLGLESLPTLLLQQDNQWTISYRDV